VYRNSIVRLSKVSLTSARWCDIRNAPILLPYHKRPRSLCDLVRPIEVDVVHWKPQIIRRICEGYSRIAGMTQDTDKRHNSRRRHVFRHILRPDRRGDVESAPGASMLAKI
jgi:hypothetical protein